MFKLYISVMEFIPLSDPKRSRNTTMLVQLIAFVVVLCLGKEEKKSTESHFTCSVFK